MNTTTQIIEEQKENFTMITDSLLAIPIGIIKPQQKILISLILRFQKNDLKFFMSDAGIGIKIGLKKSGVTSLVDSCRRSFPTFFINETKANENGIPFRILSINLKNFNTFLSLPDKKEVMEKVKKVNKVTQIDLYDTIAEVEAEEMAEEAEVKKEEMTEEEEVIIPAESEAEDEDENEELTPFEKMNKEINISGYSTYKVGQYLVPNFLLTFFQEEIETKLGLLTNIKRNTSQLSFNYEIFKKMSEQIQYS